MPIEDDLWEHLRLATKLKFPRFDGSKSVGGLYQQVAESLANLPDFHRLA